MNMVTTSVRVPIRIKEEAEALIKEGYFKNLSEFIVSGMRKELTEYSPSKAVRDIREFRHRTWQNFLKEANGDYKKAAKLYDNAIEESWKECELKKWADANNKYL